jgi:hypothetical protein
VDPLSWVLVDGSLSGSLDKVFSIVGGPGWGGDREKRAMRRKRIG